MITLTLPWPPTVNHYWGRRGNRSFILPRGLMFRKIVALECIAYAKSELYDKKLSLFVCAFPPDRRHRDLDNVLKALLDALQYAEVYETDFRINCIYIKRMPDLLGQVVVKIEECIV